MAVAFIRGIQGDHPRYLKAIATAKHYAVHSGPEEERHSFDAVVSQRDLRKTYLRAFKMSVEEGRVASIMGAYNRTNGEACCASKTLLQDILRDEWGFDGYVVSDCGAIRDIHQYHQLTSNAAESAALAVKNGCELNCGETYWAIMEAVARGLVSEQEIDCALGKLLRARFLLGMFDPDHMVPYASIPPGKVSCQEHRRLALQMARESMVLLKNENDLLPLPRDLRHIVVVGPNADSLDVLLANYNGFPAGYVTPFEGIVEAVSPGTNVSFVSGCDLFRDSTAGFDHALNEARRSDLVIAVMGLSPSLEGEEGEAAYSDACGDRINIGLPRVQEDFLKQLCNTGAPVVLVLMNGGAVAINWAAENIPAILEAWYPGEQGGRAIAEVLFGDYNPGGRLPVTFVKSVDQVPPFEDYAMKGRTYRFMKEEPLFPFGYGLGYTGFEYCELTLSKERIRPDEGVTISASVRNAGKHAGDEVVQLYVSDPDASVPVPIRHLEGFKRVHLAPGESVQVSFELRPEQLAAYDEEGCPFVEPGEFLISVGGGQPGAMHGASISARLTVR